MRLFFLRFWISSQLYHHDFFPTLCTQEINKVNFNSETKNMIVIDDVYKKSNCIWIAFLIYFGTNSLDQNEHLIFIPWMFGFGPGEFQFYVNQPSF